MEKNKKNQFKSRGYVERTETVATPKKKKKNVFVRAFSALKNRYNKMKSYQRALCVLLVAAFVCGAAIGGAYIRDGVVTASLFDAYQDSIDDGNFSGKTSCAGVAAVKSEVSYGYAAVEIFASYMGEPVTEESLLKEYGDGETPSYKFAKIMNEQLVSYSTTPRKNMKNSEALTLIYKQINKGIPVPVELATRFEGKWTKSFAIIYALDAENDEIMLANVFGEKETIYLSDFFSRTSFRAYQNMPVSYSLGFAFGIYSRNTFYEISRVTSKS